MKTFTQLLFLLLFISFISACSESLLEEDLQRVDQVKSSEFDWRSNGAAIERITSSTDIADELQTKIRSTTSPQHIVIDLKRIADWSKTVSVDRNNVTIEIKTGTRFFLGDNDISSYFNIMGYGVKIIGGEWNGHSRSEDHIITDAIFQIIRGANNTTIQECEFRVRENVALGKGKKVQGIRIYGGITRRIFGCVFRNLNFDVLTVGKESVTNLYIHDNDAYLHSDSGNFVLLQGQNHYVSIQRNIIRGFIDNAVGGHLIQTAQQTGNSPITKNLRIGDNVFWCNKRPFTEPGGVPDNNGSSGDVISIRYSDNFMVNKNLIRGSGELSISAVYNSSGRITRNTIVDSDGAAISIGSDASALNPPTNILIDNNKIINSALHAAGQRGESEYCRDGKGYPDNCNSFGNIRIWRAGQITVRNNTLIDVQSYGFYINPGVGQTEDNLMEEIKISHNKFIGIDRDSTKFHVRGCLSVPYEAINTGHSSQGINDCPSQYEHTAMNHVRCLRTYNRSGC